MTVLSSIRYPLARYKYQKKKKNSAVGNAKHMDIQVSQVILNIEKMTLKGRDAALKMTLITAM